MDNDAAKPRTLSQVPKSEYDLFVSYAHVDNLPVVRVCWVDAFVEDFTNALASRLGQHPAVFFDKQEIRMQEDFDDRINSGIGSSSLFVAIASPGYSQSAYCAGEWDAFQKKHPEGLKLDRGNRCLEVVKGRTDRLVPGSEGFTFCDASGPLKRDSPMYLSMIETLADETTAMLHYLRDQCKPMLMPRPPEFDRKGPEWSNYNMLKGLFHRMGYRVLPYSTKVDLAELQSALPSAAASVYFLGENEKRFEDVVTKAVSSGKDVTVILAPNKKAQDSFAWPLSGEGNMTFRTASPELFEELKKVFERKFGRPEPGPPLPPPENSIYLMCDEQSDVTVQKWISKIRAKEYSVIIPEETGQAGPRRKKTSDIREENQRSLETSSKVVLVWGSRTDLNAFKQKIKTIKTASVAAKPRAVHLPPPMSDAKTAAKTAAASGATATEARFSKTITVIDDDDERKIDDFLRT